MNKHIELVEKWLNDNNSVSLEELRANKDTAAADAAAAAASYAAAYEAANAASAAYGTTYAAANTTYDAEYYVKRYKELTK